MTRNAKIFLPILVLVLGAVLAAVIVAARPKVVRQEGAVPPLLVRVMEVHKGDVPLDVRSNGTVAPATESVLVAQVAGQVVRVAPQFAAGGFFRRGDELLRIDPRDYELGVQQAEAQVARARVALEREQAEVELARSEWEELGDGEPTALTLREPQLAEARAGLEAAEAALELARLHLERTTVRAPFDGRIREKRADVGQYVAPGTPVAAVFSTDWAEIRLPVAEKDLAFLDLELGSELSSETRPRVRLRGELAGQARDWRAEIVRTDSQIDPKTRMLHLFARVPDPFARRTADRPPLPMGIFLEAEIEGRVARDAAILPRSALRDGARVLVVDAESRLRYRPVEVLRYDGERVVVGSGLEEGEQVCVSTLETVVDGMPVRTVVEPPPLETDRDRERRL